MRAQAEEGSGSALTFHSKTELSSTGSSEISLSGPDLAASRHSSLYSFQTRLTAMAVCPAAGMPPA